jgi:DNA repair protein RecO (recombination protein O)
MPARETEAIVLRSFPLGDADRIVSLFTRSFGRLKGVAKNARNPKSRFGSTLEAFSYLRVWFHENETRELVRLRQCELIESFLDVQQDYRSGLALALLAEIMETIWPEREASDSAFRLLLLTAQTIKKSRQPEFPLEYFSLWSVRLAGWLPELDRCVHCGREALRETLHGPALSPGLYCSRCRRPGMQAISASSLAAARRMLAERPERLDAERGSVETRRDLQEYLLDMIEHHAEHHLTTRRMLEARL